MKAEEPSNVRRMYKAIIIYQAFESVHKRITLFKELKD
jgi:hypothetical protein